jgi:hypothetical protein
MTVSLLPTIVGLAAIVVVFPTGIWAIRLQRRQFPKDFDRTGWKPEREHTAWFNTKFTWLSGGRG